MTPLLTTRQTVSLLVFVGGIALLVLAGVIYDVFAALSGTNSTISWVMSIIGYRYPFVAFAWGLFVGIFGIGLAAHFWFGVMKPAEWDELQRLRTEEVLWKSKTLQL